MELTAQQEAALALLEALHKRDKLYTEVNKTIRDLQKDFPGLLSVMDCELFDPVIALCDAVLGDQIASYYWFECIRSGSGCIQEGSKIWRINNLGDVRKFVARPREE